MKCLFCEIASGKVPAAVIHEDDEIIAFLDICPIRPGHTQIIPKAHVAYFDELPSSLMLRMTEVAQHLSRILKEIYKVPRVAFLFTGGDIAHVHAHVVPMHEKTDITSRLYIAEPHLTFHSTPRMAEVELERIAEVLKNALKESRP
jgi:histidine triad (HIT) family protein